MWFIDDSLRKNRKYYLAEMEKMAKDYNALIKEVFKDLDFINVSGLEPFSGLDKSNMSAYIKSTKKLSKKNYDKIMASLREAKRIMNERIA